MSATQEVVDRIRRDCKWPPDDVILVIHTDKANSQKVMRALESVGISKQDGVEIVPKEVK